MKRRVVIPKRTRISSSVAPPKGAHVIANSMRCSASLLGWLRLRLASVQPGRRLWRHWRYWRYSREFMGIHTSSRDCAGPGGRKVLSAAGKYAERHPFLNSIRACRARCAQSPAALVSATLQLAQLQDSYPARPRRAWHRRTKATPPRIGGQSSIYQDQHRVRRSRFRDRASGSGEGLAHLAFLATRDPG